MFVVKCNLHSSVLQNILFAFVTTNLVMIHLILVAMLEWLGCLAHTTQVRCSNLDATRDRVSLGTSVTAVCLGSPGLCTEFTCDIHRPLWVFSVYGELK
jgi:hypothetical protein